MGADAAAQPQPARPRRADEIVDILGRIRDRLDSFSPAERKVGRAVLSDVHRAVEDSIASLALRAGVSEPSVTRFCRALGCSGVRDFKLRLAQSLVVGDHYLTPDAVPDAPEADTPPYWASILNDAHQALHQVERQLSPDAVRTAAAAIAGARQVTTIGLGGSGAALAEEVRCRLFRYGVPVTCCAEAYLMRMSAAAMGPRDVIVAISVSGRTAEMIETVDLARAYGATTIAITAAHSPLAGAADHALGVAVAENSDTLTPTPVRFAYLAVIDLLSAATGYTLGPEAREILRRIKYSALNHRSGNSLEPLGD